jgi:hypothetical protein
LTSSVFDRKSRGFVVEIFGCGFAAPGLSAVKIFQWQEIL